MKNFLLYTLATFLLAFVFVFDSAAQTNLTAANQQLALWKTFSPAGKNFKVYLPAEPEQLGESETQTLVSSMNQQVSKSNENVEVSFLKNVTAYNLDTRWNGYGIIVLDFKWQTVDYDEKTGVLTLSSETTTDDVTLSEWLRFEKARKLPNGTFMSEMSFNVNGKNIKSRALAVKNQVFLLFVGTVDLSSATPELVKVFQAETDKFFNSFQILDNKPQVARGTAAKSAKATN